MSTELAVAIGWVGVLLSFISGMALGLNILNDSFLGGYASIRRRYFRLAHIALAALGIITVIAGICAKVGFQVPITALLLLVIGLISMPAVCVFFAFSRKGFYFFPLPVLSLVSATVLIVRGLLVG